MKTKLPKLNAALSLLNEFNLEPIYNDMGFDGFLSVKHGRNWDKYGKEVSQRLFKMGWSKLPEDAPFSENEEHFWINETDES